MINSFLKVGIVWDNIGVSIILKTYVEREVKMVTGFDSGILIESTL